MTGYEDPLAVEREVRVCHARYGRRRSPSTAARSGPDHFGYDFSERGLRRPSQHLTRLGRVTYQKIDLGRPEVAGIDLHAYRAGRRIAPLLARALAVPSDLDACLREGKLDELTNGMGLTGRQHVVIRRIVIDDSPHTVHVVAGMAPVAPRVQVSQIDAVLQAMGNRGDCPSDFAGHERLASRRSFVVEQNAIGGVQSICLTIVRP